MVVPQSWITRVTVVEDASDRESEQPGSNMRHIMAISRRVVCGWGEE